MAANLTAAQEAQLVEEIIALTAAQFDLPSTFGAYLICTCLGCM